MSKKISVQGLTYKGSIYIKVSEVIKILIQDKEIQKLPEVQTYIDGLISTLAHAKDI